MNRSVIIYGAIIFFALSFLVGWNDMKLVSMTLLTVYLAQIWKDIKGG